MSCQGMEVMKKKANIGRLKIYRKELGRDAIKCEI